MLKSAKSIQQWVLIDVPYTPNNPTVGVGHRRNAPARLEPSCDSLGFQTAVLRTGSRVAGNARKTHVEAARTAEKSRASAARGQRVASEAV